MLGYTGTKRQPITTGGSGAAGRIFFAAAAVFLFSLLIFPGVSAIHA